MSIELKLNKLVVPVDHFTFKGGEEQVKIDLTHAPHGCIGFVDITAKIKNSADIMVLALLVDAVSRLENLDVHAEFTLNLPYIPYARQDRVMQPGEALSIKVFANIINSLGFDKVIVDDPHSDVSTALLNNVKIRSQDTLFASYVGGEFGVKPRVDLSGNCVFVAPDAGARKKAQKVADLFRLPLVEAGKTRNVVDGKITDTVLYGQVSGKECVIVDDIADFGNTFKALGKILKEQGAKKVTLYVTHGIFAGGVDCFDGVIDEIHSYHPWMENIDGRNEIGIFKG